MGIHSKAAVLTASVVLAIILFWPGLSGPFLFDDYPNIVNNGAIHVTELSFASLRNALSGPEAGPLGRPVSVLSFAVSHYLHGLAPFYFKATNLALHLLNALLLYALLSKISPRLLREAEGSHWLRQWLPIAVVAAWIAHPINAVPIFMPVQRMTLLAATFGLTALLCHAKALETVGWRSVGLYSLAWGICWPLAVFSKETGLLLPLYGLLVYWAQGKGEQARHSRILYAGLLLVLVMLLLALPAAQTWLESAYTNRSFTLEQRVLTEFRVLAFYASQILVPRFQGFGLFLDDFTISQGLLSPISTAASIIGWIAVLCAALLYRSRAPLFFFGILWFVAGHLLESTVVPLEIAFEHRNYFPSIGLLLAGLALVDKMRSILPREQARFAIFVIVIGAIVYMYSLTWLRSVHFSEPLQFALMEAEYHPNSPRANLVAATSLMDAGFGQTQDFATQAIRFHLERSIELDQNHKSAYLYLLIWKCGTGRDVEETAILDFENRLQSTPFGPFDSDMPKQLARLTISAGGCLRGDQVKKLFLAGANNELVSASVRSQFLEALSDYELVVSRDPGSAKSLLAEALSLQPNDARLSEKLRGYETLPTEME